MAGLVPAIHDLASLAVKTWMPGITSGMTTLTEETMTRFVTLTAALFVALASPKSRR